MLNSAGLAEVQKALRELMQNAPYTMLSIIPEIVDHAVGAMSVGPFAQRPGGRSAAGHCRGGPCQLMDMMLKPYFSYYPEPNHTKVPPYEAETSAWLNAQMEEILRAAS